MEELWCHGNHPVLGDQRLHTGVDWAGPRGAPVTSTRSGRVSSVAVLPDYGNTVIVDHGGGWQTLYAHLASFSVSAGDCIEAGSVVGTVGATDITVGTGLHFEVRRDDQAVDPMQLPLTRRALKGKP